MKLQTERIDNHRAQFTIEIETERLEDAKQKAARKISRQVRIKGFRKGKAPYRLVAQHVGEGAILEEALEALGDVLYKQALEESEVETYGPGAFDNFELEPAPTFTFSVPLQPEVYLKDFRQIRLDFKEPQASAEQVEKALKEMQLLAVEVTDDNVQVAAAGNRVVIDVESEFVDGEAPAESAEADAALLDQDSLTGENSEPNAEAAPAPYIPKMGDTFAEDYGATIILDPNEDPFTHGFVEHLIGVELGSDVEFELTIPDDDADETIHGRRVRFHVSLTNIEAISIPELDDEFALKVSRGRGDDEMDLASLRAATQDQMERMMLEEAKSDFCDEVLQKTVDDAEIQYADETLDEYIDDMIGDFERNLTQQRIKPKDYYRITDTAKDDLREQYRDSAIQALRHTLVLRQLISEQEIEASEEDIELRLDLMTASHEAGQKIRELFDTPQMRENIRKELVLSHLYEHIFAIGRGEDPAAAVETFRAQMASDAKRAKVRSERLQRYHAEDEAAARTEEQSNGAELEVFSEAETAASGDESTSA